LAQDIVEFLNTFPFHRKGCKYISNLKKLKEIENSNDLITTVKMINSLQFLCAKVIRENNIPTSTLSPRCIDLCDSLVEGCCFNIVKRYSCNIAAANGHLDCLKYAHEKEHPWGEATCNLAALYGHLECLKYAHENGCHWWLITCRAAAANGHLDCLKYAHENDCPWDESTYYFAARRGHLDCLKYAHENKCPWKIWTRDWNMWTGQFVAKGGHPECINYFIENCCPRI
jgi:hypothetical protein